MSGTRSASPHANGTTSTAALTVRGLCKRFSSTLAVDDVTFEVASGEVHALLGHNGSGKSTVVKMISGLIAADSGDFSTALGSNGPARTGIVHQDLALCHDATVMENCCMGGYVRGRARLIDWKAERRELQPVLDSLEVDFQPDTMVRDLSPANQAIVAIARAIKGPQGAASLNLLILDEATARLRGKDADLVLATARRVAAQGGGVLLVTHHMSEVLKAADRATILSNGAVVETVDVASTDEESLLSLVSGRKLTALRETSSNSLTSQLPPTLITDKLTGDILQAVSLVAHPGEILGITGATGAGFEELPYLIARSGRARSGSVSIDGEPMRARTAADSRRRGVGLVPDDRLRQGLHAGASVTESLSPLVRAVNTAIGLVQHRREHRWAAAVCEEFQVKLAGPEVAIGALSGGNQQKVLLARVLKDNPRLLILHEPTQGVDEATRRSLIELIRKAADDGTAVLYVSCDIEEVAGSSDRVLVFREGRCVRELPGGLGQADDIYAASYLVSTAEDAPSATMRPDATAPMW